MHRKACASTSTTSLLHLRLLFLLLAAGPVLPAEILADLAPGYDDVGIMSVENISLTPCEVSRPLPRF